MIERIILTTIGIAILSFSLKKGDSTSILIMIGLFTGVVLTWSETSFIITAGMIIYALSSFSVMIFKTEKIIMPIAGFLAFSAILFTLLHLQFYSILKACLVIPLAGYIFLLSKKFGRKVSSDS